jgi:hypothetical protein
VTRQVQFACSGVALDHPRQVHKHAVHNRSGPAWGAMPTLLLLRPMLAVECRVCQASSCHFIHASLGIHVRPGQPRHLPPCVGCAVWGVGNIYH